MNREDYLIREISKISEFLLALIGKRQKQEITKEDLDVSFEEETGISFYAILKTSDAELRKLLESNKAFNTQNIELLADFLAEQEEIHYKIKAIELYNLCEQMDRTFSLNRDYKLSILKQAIL